MNISQLLKEIPGIQKRFVYYLEEKGHIHPRKIPKARLNRREYSEKDVKLIQRAFDLYKEGYSPRSAVDIARTSGRDNKSHLLSMRFSSIYSGVEKTFAHAGPNEDKYIKIFPTTQVLIVAKEAEAGECFVLRASVHIDSQVGPFIIRFRKGSEIIREMTTDVGGNATHEGLTREDVEALKCCELEVSKSLDLLTVDDTNIHDQ